MTKHISDSERFTLAALNRKEIELKEAYEKIDNLNAQLRAMKEYVTELRLLNKTQSRQISYLFSKQNNHA